MQNASGTILTNAAASAFNPADAAAFREIGRKAPQPRDVAMPYYLATDVDGSLEASPAYGSCNNQCKHGLQHQSWGIAGAIPGRSPHMYIESSWATEGSTFEPAELPTDLFSAK